MKDKLSILEELDREEKKLVQLNQECEKVLAHIQQLKELLASIEPINIPKQNFPSTSKGIIPQTPIGKVKLFHLSLAKIKSGARMKASDKQTTERYL